jgi:hypothetical protein
LLHVSKKLLHVMCGLVMVLSILFQFDQCRRLKVPQVVLDAEPPLRRTMGSVVDAVVCVPTAWRQKAAALWNVQTVEISLSL